MPPEPTRARRRLGSAVLGAARKVAGTPPSVFPRPSGSLRLAAYCRLTGRPGRTAATKQRGDDARRPAIPRVVMELLAHSTLAQTMTPTRTSSRPEGGRGRPDGAPTSAAEANTRWEYGYQAGDKRDDRWVDCVKRVVNQFLK